MIGRTHPSGRFALVAITAGCLAVAASVSGQVTNEDFKVLASDGAGLDFFGAVVAIDNGVMVAGSRKDDDNGLDSGSAYLFNFATGAQIAKLLSTDGAIGDNFGTSVAIGGGVVVVGANGDNVNGAFSGSAYIFDAITGAQQFKLVPDDGAASDQFGGAVAAGDGFVIVGSHANDDLGSESGSAYVFNASTGVQLFKLLPLDGALFDHFGRAVAIGSGVVAVGAWIDDDNGNASGSVYLFDPTSGLQTHKILPLDGAAGDNFGWSLAIENGILAVGATGDDDNGSDSGSAYLFNLENGAQIAKLTPDDGQAGDNFSRSIAIRNGTLAVGASSDDDNGNSSGSGYLFDVLTTTQLTKLLPSDGAANDFSGTGIAIEGGAVALGTSGDDDRGGESGSVYMFLVPGTSCAADTNHDGLVTPADFTAWIAAFNADAPECDQNGDSECTPADFTAWIANYNAGCP